MKQNSDNKKHDEEIENPMLFWGGIGTAISASLSVVMQASPLNMVLSILAGISIGCLLGYSAKKQQDNTKR